MLFQKDVMKWCMTTFKAVNGEVAACTAQEIMNCFRKEMALSSLVRG